MTRQKKATVVPPKNLTEAEMVMKQYAEADAKRELINAKMDKAITEIRAEHANELQEINSTITSCFDKMQIFAETKPELFEKKKSFETSHGLIGFRTGTPKLKARKGYTLKSALKLLERFNAQDYIRTKVEMAKDILIANRNQDECKKLMDDVGLEVVQEDTFYIELKKEETNVL